MLDGLFFGTAAQGEAARLWRACRALREQEDEDARGHGAGQPATPSKELPRLRAAEFVRLGSAEQREQVIGHRAGCAGVRGARRATECGEGCEGLDGFGSP